MNVISNLLNAVRPQRPAPPVAPPTVKTSPEPEIAFRIENPRPLNSPEAEAELARAYPKLQRATNRILEALEGVVVSPRAIGHLARLVGVDLVTASELAQFKAWHEQWYTLNVAAAQNGWDAVAKAYRDQFSGEAPPSGVVRSKESMNEAAKLVRQEIRARQREVMRRALPAIEVIRQRLSEVGHAAAAKLESEERSRAAELGVEYRPSELLRVAQKIGFCSGHFIDAVTETPTSPLARISFALAPSKAS